MPTCVNAMRAVDTNVLVRLVTRDDAKQVVVAENFVADGAWVSILALAEATWVLTSVYDRSPGDIATAVEMLLNHQQLTLQEPEAVAAALDTFRRRPTLGFFRLGTGPVHRTRDCRRPWRLAQRRFDRRGRHDFHRAAASIDVPGSRQQRVTSDR